MKNFSKLEKKLGIKFNNKDLLKQAFTHRSYLNENPDFNLDNNERLEFLGDAVLELIVTEDLFKNHKNPEGELTSWRAALVNTDSLSESAKKLNLEDFLLLSKGELNDSNKKARYCILANTFEAFLGALYLDKGYEECQKFVRKNILIKLPEILKKGSWHNAKSSFQEKAQEKEGLTPYYKIVEEWGPDHDKHFLSGVFLGKKLIAKGEGSSKQEAEEKAAQLALEEKNWK